MRSALALASFAAAFAVFVLPAAAGDSGVGAAEHVVRNDLRRCPSPMCGGYWVALANHARTRCYDGLRRPRCYVATALDDDRRPFGGSIPEGALVRGTITGSRFPGFEELGALVVSVVREPVGREARGRFFRIKDLGVRCVRAPCFSWRAFRLNSRGRADVSDVDLAAAGLTAAQQRRAETALSSRDGLFAFGRIVTTAEGGRSFRAARMYLSVKLRA